MTPGERWRKLAEEHKLDLKLVERKAKAAYSWRGAIPVWENTSENVKDYMRLQSIIATITE